MSALLTATTLADRLFDSRAILEALGARMDLMVLDSNVDPGVGGMLRRVLRTQCESVNEVGAFLSDEKFAHEVSIGSSVAEVPGDMLALADSIAADAAAVCEHLEELIGGGSSESGQLAGMVLQVGRIGFLAEILGMAYGKPFGHRKAMHWLLQRDDVTAAVQRIKAIGGAA